MTKIAAQIWNGSNFTIERLVGEEPGMISFRLTGPFTARDMYGSMSPDAFHSIFDSPLNSDEPRTHCIDLTQVPYMDSQGRGLLVRLYVRCRAKGIRLTVTGLSPRVLELFRLAKVDELLLPSHAV
jgi:anti-anti-sigma factor